MSALGQKRTDALGHVRFAPKSGHVQCETQCPLWANSGPQPMLFDHLTSLREH